MERSWLLMKWLLLDTNCFQVLYSNTRDFTLPIELSETHNINSTKTLTWKHYFFLSVFFLGQSPKETQNFFILK